MKIKKVASNNRKKAFEVTTPKGAYEYPYSRLALSPTDTDTVQAVFSDPEIGHTGFTYQLVSGQEDTVLMDQVLEYAKDPEYIRRAMLLKMTVQAQERIKRLGVSKREVIRRMGVAPSQFYRLMDQKNTRKTIDQMVRLLSAMDCSVELVFDWAA
ncbi:XRE family transcriptional regulator [Bdellovibrionota bacterium FG-2]